MSRRLFFRWMMICMFVMAMAAPLHAQLPTGCSNADQKRNADYATRAVEALMQGNSQRFTVLQSEMESGLSKACMAALDSQYPARVRCTANERVLVLQHYNEMIRSALNRDTLRFIQIFLNLDQSVSPACCVAIRRPDHPLLHQACSSSELDVIASYGGPILRATMNSLQTGDYSPIFQLAGNMTAQLSERCYAANAEVGRIQQLQAQPGQMSRPPLSNVNNHGGGTFSVSGVGACTPGGCMSF